MLHYAAVHLGISGFCGIFAAIYEHFSFGVYSDAMIFSFMPCLFSGLLLVLTALGRRAPGKVFLELLTACVITMAVGMISAGVVEIYGTNNKLLYVYPVTAGVLLLLTIAAYFLPKRAELERS